MAVKTYRLGSGSDGNFAALFESDQTAATRTDGWTVAKVATTWSSEFDNGTKQVSGSFSAEVSTTKPASFLTGATANAFKIPTALTGTFAATAWSFVLAVRATVASAQTGRIRMAFYKGVNADGSAASSIGSFGGGGIGVTVGSTTAALSTTADVTTTVFANPGVTITLTNEFLFFVIAWETVVAGGNNSADVQLRTGQASAGTRLTTPDFTASGGGSTYTKAGYARESA